MGIYFNPGNEAFRKDAKSEIYIDKTGLINVTNKLLNEEKNCISVSHARRFGKSQAARMLKSYYRQYILIYLHLRMITRKTLLKK